MNQSVFIRIILLIILLSSAATFAALQPESFFSRPSTVLAKLSPNGSKLITLNLSEDNQVLTLVDPANLKNKQQILNVQEYLDDNSVIQSVSWVDNQHLALQLLQVKKGVKQLLDTKSKSQLLILKIMPNNSIDLLSVRTKGWMVDPKPNVEKKILFAKTGAHSKIYEIDVSKLLKFKQRPSKLTRVDGGQFTKANEIISTEGFVTRWFFDLEGGIKAALRFKNRELMELISYNETEQTVLKSWGKKEFDLLQDKDQDGEVFLPIALHPDENTFYSINLNEDNEKSVYLVNFKTNESKIVYTTNAFKLLDLIFDDVSGELIGAKVLESGKVRYEYKNASMATRTKESDKINVTVSQAANNSRIVYQESHNQPGHFVLKHKNKSLVLGGYYPKLLNKLKSRLIQDRITVDNLEIPYLLSLPNKTKAPLVVLPHGGPIGVHDDIYFDPITQFLTYRGYAVLRVNYRGSSGYSKEFEEAGKKQWGNLILEDILAATKAVRARNDIDANRVCIMGMSYGGYAATMLTIRHPDLFKCGINISGVADLPLYLNSPYITEKQFEWGKEFIGDPKVDYEYLLNISPVTKISKLERPLFVAHGNKDAVVDVEHAFRLKHLLEASQKQFQFLIFEEAGHHFYDENDRTQLFTSAEKFLQKHLK